MVLIDTAGMAQRDARTRELLDMLSHRAIKPAGAQRRGPGRDHRGRAVRLPRRGQCRGVVLSKIDEAVKLGPALDALIRHKLKVLAWPTASACPKTGTACRPRPWCSAPCAAANPNVAFAGLALERLAAAASACSEPQRKVLVVDTVGAAPHEMAMVDLAACIEPLDDLRPNLSYLAARGLPLRHVDARGSCDGFLEALTEAAPDAGVVIVHAEAAELGRLFARRAPRPLMLAADHPTSVTSAYANMKLLSQRHGLMAFDLLLVAAASSPRTPRIAELQPLVRRLAHQMIAKLPANVELDDLIQVGMIGLTDALGALRRRQGVQFETFATQRIRGAMLDELRGSDWMSRGDRKPAAPDRGRRAQAEQRWPRPQPKARSPRRWASA
jgi:hypothetical protein